MSRNESPLLPTQFSVLSRDIDDRRSSIFSHGVLIVAQPRMWRSRDLSYPRASSVLDGEAVRLSGDNHRFYISTSAPLPTLAPTPSSLHITVAPKGIANMCGADCFLMLLSVLFPPIGGM